MMGYGLYYRVVVVSILFVMSGCQQPVLNKGEIKLKSLSEYSLNDFHLTKDVKYFEIVKYYPYSSKPKRDPLVLFQYDKTNLQTISHFMKEKMRNFTYTGRGFAMYRKPNIDPKDPALTVACIVGYIGDNSRVANIVIRYIDHNSRIGIVKNKTDLKAFLGQIDTPSEIQLLHSLGGKHEAYSYIKAGDSYRLRLDYTVYYSSTKRSESVKSFVMMNP